MAEQEKFSWSKFFQGFTNPVTTAKNTQYTLWIALVVLAGFTIWKAFFMPTQKMQTTIRVEKGGTANITQTQAPQKKLQFFIGAYGGTNNSAGIIAGVLF